MTSAIVAYAVAFLFLGACSAILGSVLTSVGLLGIGKPTTWSLIGGTAGAIAAYWICKHFFNWMDIHFGWYSYLASMFLVVLNDGKRASYEGPEAAGIESSRARGTLMGIIASLTTHFIL